jgi:hypothetical protein
MSEVRITSDGAAAVDPDYFWREMDTCPRGVKVQLLGEGGVATYGEFNGKDPFWINWAPLPKRRPTQGKTA